MKTEISSLQPGRYRHYKGNFYEVLETARHSETEELMVVYRALYGDHSLWVRPLRMFLEEIVLDGQHVRRFEWVAPNHKTPVATVPPMP